MSLIRQVGKNNPMMAEARLINGRMLGKGSWNTQHRAAAWVGGVMYLFFMGMVLRYNDVFPPVALFYLLLTALLILLPLSLHGVIAGEREKRSLEMLLAAPVTSKQIVVAKLARVSGLVIVTYAFLLGPALLLMVAQGINGKLSWIESSDTAYLSPWISAALAVVIVSSAAFLNACISLNISAHAKNAAASMMTNLAAHFGLLLASPLVLGIVTSLFRNGNGDLLLMIHPYGLLTWIGWGQSSSPFWSPAFIVPVVLLVCAAWVGLGVFCLHMASRRLDKERLL